MKLIVVVVIATLLNCVFTNEPRKRSQKKSPEKSQNQQFFLNDGTTTSVAPDPRSLTHEDICEVNEIVNSISALITGRSINFDGNLTTYTHNYPAEIEIISETYKSLSQKGMYGRATKNNRKLEARKRYFDRRMEEKEAEINYEIRYANHYQDVPYIVDVEKRTITFIQTEEPVCESEVAKKEKLYEAEKRQKKHTKRKTTTVKKMTRPKKLIKPAPTSPGPSSDNNPRISDHHIIPSKLLEDFYKILEEIRETKQKVEPQENSHIVITNDCVNILKLRMKNFEIILSIGSWIERKKNIAVEGLELNVDIKSLVDDNYRDEIEKRWKFWSTMGGVVYRGPGPGERGPFDPNMRYHRYGFEDDSGPIVGEARLRLHRQVYEGLITFVENQSNMTDLEKEKRGEVLQNLLFAATESCSLTPFNPEQWHKIIPSAADLDRLKDQNLRKTFENRTFWAIKQQEPKSDSSKRSKRFITDENKLKNEKLDVVILQRWLEFVLVSMNGLNKADSRNQSLEWSHDFNNLYDQYLNDDWTNVLCENSSTTTGGFDQFLYSKMFFQGRWLDCFISNQRIENEIDKELCITLRRVILSSDSDGKNIWFDKSTRPRQFLKDMNTIWKQLNKILETNRVPKTIVMVERKDNSIEAVDVHLYTNVINVSSIVMPLIQYNVCLKNTLTSVKREVDKLDEFYEREWFLYADDNLKCL